MDEEEGKEEEEEDDDDDGRKEMVNGLCLYMLSSTYSSSRVHSTLRAFGKQADQLRNLPQGMKPAISQPSKHTHT